MERYFISHIIERRRERTEPEIALLGFGVLDDITGARIEQIPAQKVKEVLEGVA